MQVFIVYQGSYSDRGCVAVVSTLAFAVRYVAEKAADADSDYVFDDHDIENHIVDAPDADVATFDGRGNPKN